MNDKAFHFLMLQLGQLTPSQRHQLHRYFQQADTGAADTLLVEHSPTCCPHCQASRLRPQSAALPLRPMQAYLQSVDRNSVGTPA